MVSVSRLPAVNELLTPSLLLWREPQRARFPSPSLHTPFSNLTLFFYNTSSGSVHFDLFTILKV